MRSTPILVSMLTILALAATATAEVGVSGELDEFLTAMENRVAELAPAADSGDRDAKKAVKRLGKIEKKLTKPNASRSYAHEMKAVAKAAKILEKKLPGETELLDLLSEVAEFYRADIEAALAEIDALLLTEGLTKRDRKRAEKARKKAEKQLSRTVGETRLSKRLKRYSKSAKVTDPVPGAGSLSEPTPGMSAVWVVSDVAVATGGRGLDLDGDGSVDNALGGLLPTLSGAGFDIDALIEESFSETGQAALIEMWGIRDWDDDDVVFAGLVNGTDLDGDPADNFSGEEPFDADAGLLPDDHPRFRTATSLSTGGSYEIELVGEEIEFAGFVLPAGVPIAVSGAASPEENTGLIGFGIPYDLIKEIAADRGITIGPLLDLALRFALDLDLDEDGTNDALSGAFDFTSVAARFE